MQTSPSYIYLNYQKFICPRCEFPLNSTIHIPIVIPCGHTFCSTCLEEEYLEKKQYRCDLCKAEFSEHYSKFPKNLYILSIRHNKLKNENIFVGGKSPPIIKETNNNSRMSLGRINSSNISINYSYGGSQMRQDLIRDIYTMHNEITYTFFNNKLEMIKRDLELIKKEEDPKTDCSSDYSNKKSSGRFRRIGSTILDSQNEYKKIKNLIENEKEEDMKEIVPKKIDFIDFYGVGATKKKKYPPLYSYFELLKKIFKYGDKFNKKYCNQIFIFIFRLLMFVILLFINIFFIKYIDVALFFLLVSIWAENENTIYEISTKIKMFLALSCFYFVENIVKSLGFRYLIDMSSYISNMSNGTRTLFNLLVLGNDSTLNLIVFTILNILSNLHLLLN